MLDPCEKKSNYQPSALMAFPHSYNNHGVLILLWVLFLLVITTIASSDWLNHGGDLYNRRYAKKETKISPKTASKLQLKWKFFAGGDITATPAIFDQTVYFPTWNGSIHAVNAVDGSLVWEKSVQEITGLNATGLIFVNVSLSRATPTIAGELLIIGIYGPAVVFAVERATGELVWLTRLDSHPSGLVTMSGTVYNGSFYVGTSSAEARFSSIQQCCTFRGSLSKLDIQTGAILWQTFTLPDNGGKLGGYAGASIWGSSPSIDITRNLVYVGTGNLYSAPQNVLDCQAKINNQTIPAPPDTCIEPDNHEDSILAFDMDNGKIVWYRQLGGYDIWFSACNNLSTPGCPPGPNPDIDFGEAPMMLTIVVNGTNRDIVAAVQKSGYAWALDRDNGDIVWSTVAGPGGAGGGGTWGAATDGQKVYTNIVNYRQVNFTLAPSNETTTAGAWVALDACTGNILWSTANPSNTTNSGPVTVANGVLFAGSEHPQGPIYAMDVNSGEILWSYNTGATVYGGMSVSNGCIYVGNGYLAAFNPSFTSGTSLYSFCISDD